MYCRLIEFATASIAPRIWPRSSYPSVRSQSHLLGLPAGANPRARFLSQRARLALSLSRSLARSLSRSLALSLVIALSLSRSLALSLSRSLALSLSRSLLQDQSGKYKLASSSCRLDLASIFLCFRNTLAGCAENLRNRSLL